MALKIAKKSSKKPLIITLIVLLVAAGGYTVFAYQNNVWPFVKNEADKSESATDGGDDSTDASGANNGSSAENTPPVNDGDSPDHTPKQNETPEGSASDKNALTGTISHSSVSDGKLVVRATINELVGSGDCTITLTRSSDGKMVTKKADIIADPSSSTCKGFDIPTSQLGSGNWNIAIDLKSGNKKGKLTGSVSI